MSRLSAVAVSLLLAAPACAGETAVFLKIPAAARPAALGSAFTALADDVSAIAWNPAGLALLRRPELGLTYARMFDTQELDYAAFALPSRYGSFATSLLILRHDALQGRDAAGRPTGSFEAWDQALGLAFARALSPALKAGLGLRLLRSRLAEDSAATFAADVGGLYRFERFPLSLGLAGRNIGPGLRFRERTDELPLTFAGGAAWSARFGLTLSAEYRYRPYSRSSEFGFGTEWRLLSAAALRMGYAAESDPGSRERRGVEQLAGFATGLGLEWRRYRADYAIAPFGELGNAHRVSVGMSF